MIQNDWRKRFIQLMFTGLLFFIFPLQGEEFSLSKLKVYPKEAVPCWQKTVFRREKPGKEFKIYGLLPCSNKAGALRFRLTCINSKELSFRMIFNSPKGRIRIPGRTSTVKLPPRTKAETAEMVFSVPHEAVSARFEISMGTKPVTAELQSLEWEYEYDVVPLVRTKVEGRPSQWKTYSPLKNFYQASGSRHAEFNTSVRLAYDEKNLYAGFIAEEPYMAAVSEKQTKKDGPVWKDDCVELYLFNAAGNSGWHFLVNPRNTRYDARLIQAMAGDPYKDRPWDGEWSSQVWKNSNSWEVLFVIPWSTLEYKGPPAELYLNFARERPRSNELSQWNIFNGNFTAAPKYARAEFRKDGVIRRYRKMEKNSYLPERAVTSGKELLSSTPGNYIVGAWPHGFFQLHYPKDKQKDFTPQKQRSYMERYAKNGMFGPLVPQAVKKSLVAGGLDELKRLNREYGMKFPYMLFGSTLHNIAIKKHRARLFIEKRTDPASQEYITTVLESIGRMKTFLEQPGNRKLVNYVHGIDEPANVLVRLYDWKKNAAQKELLDAYSDKVKAETGFGKYGCHDWSGAHDDKDTPFRKIAFYRYWNKHFAEYLSKTSEAIKKIDPKLPYLALTVNTCAGRGKEDYAVLSPYAEWCGCDPYPTSAGNFFGMNRAVYHTGFTVRMLHDLACRSRICAMPQAFIYHRGRPKPAEMREWASQALKNGAEMIVWYASGPACITMPDGFEEMLKLSNEISKMNKLILPAETKSAVFYSDYDRNALDDRACHAAYTLYSILGEHIGANFRFVNASGLENGIHTLDGIAVLYVPRMSYTDPDTTKRLLDFVRKGGTLVVFDPEFWSWNIDGSPVPERKIITGTLRKRTQLSNPLQYGNRNLYVTAAADLNRDPGQITAYDFEKNAGKTILRYPDGKPAAVEKTFGKGTVLFFGVMPFGNSDAAVNPEGWKQFLLDLCRKHGEKTGLPIWNFVLPGK